MRGEAAEEFRRLISLTASDLDEARIDRLAHPVAPFSSFEPDCKFRREEHAGEKPEPETGTLSKLIVIDCGTTQSHIIICSSLILFVSNDIIPTCDFRRYYSHPSQLVVRGLFLVDSSISSIGTDIGLSAAPYGFKRTGGLICVSLRKSYLIWLKEDCRKP